MNRKISTILFAYGVWLFLVGVIGFLSNPEKAKTALMSGGLFGSLSVAWGALMRKGVSWALPAALATTGFMVLVFTWRAWVSWSAVLQGNSEKLVAACLITGLWAASVIVFPCLWKARQTGRS
jgi:uncharacterized membrane protein (UPF0136 family)